MNTRIGAAAVVLAALVMWSGSASAGLPKNYTERWDNPAIEKRIAAGIEANRKSDATIRVTDAAGKPLANAEVKVSQKSHAFLFGCNTFVLGQMKEQEEAYREAFLKLFNFTTVPFYWKDLEPESGELRFEEGTPYVWRRPPPDRVVAWAQKNGVALKGHPLVWHNINPAWIPKDPEELKKRYIVRFKELAKRYGDAIPLWDCVNESLVCCKEYPFFAQDEVNYPLYVPWAFEAAHEVFGPKTTLMINDIAAYNWPSDKTNPYYLQCARLLKDGAGVQGIGFQFHFMSRQSLDHFTGESLCEPGALLATYELFAEFGVPLWITEITIGSAGKDGLDIQERVVRDMYRLWFSSRAMAGITWWNLGDAMAYGGEGRADGGLVDKDLKPKPAYEVLDQLINHDWTTQADLRTNRDGVASFRGFHGAYDVEVKAGGKTKTFEMSVKAGEAAKETVVLP